MTLETAGKTVSMLEVLELGDDMSLPDDVVLYSKKIDDKLSSKCFYDGVMATFILRLFKEDNLDTGIGLRLEAIRYIMMLFPRLEAILNRYADRMMYLPYRFQIGDMLYLTVGQNPSNFGGKKFIDVREHVPSYKDASKLVPTKSGIRISPDIIQKFKRLIKTCLDESARLIEASSQVFNEVKVFILEREIRTTALLFTECDHCSVDHKAAMKHVKSGLCTETRSWQEIVKLYFKDSVKGLRRAEVIRLAARTNKRLGGSPFVTEELKETNDVELEQILLAISKPNKGRVYKHMHDITKEEEEEIDRNINKEVKDEIEAEATAVEGDIESDDDKESLKKKAKHVWVRKWLDEVPSSTQTNEEPKTKKIKIEQSSPLDGDETIKIETSEESE